MDDPKEVKEDLIFAISEMLVATHKRLENLEPGDLQEVSIFDLFKINEELDQVVERLDRVLPNKGGC